MRETEDNNQIDGWNLFVQDGNLDALSGTYFHYYDMLFAYGLKHTSEKQSVEDAIQDVFINLIKFRKGIGDVKNLPGYLVATFRRQLFLDLNRRRNSMRTEQLPEEQFDFYRATDPDFSYEENLEKVQLVIQQCIKNLSPKQQEIMFLRFEKEISYEEIAGMLQISVDSCYKSVYRSIRNIRMEVEKILGKGGFALFLIFSHHRT